MNTALSDVSRCCQGLGRVENPSRASIYGLAQLSTFFCLRVHKLKQLWKVWLPGELSIGGYE